MNFKQVVLIIVFFFVSASFVNAASLYLEPSSGSYAEGTSFSVKIRVDNQDECINAAGITLKYPSSSIKAIDVSRGESIFSLWTVEPVIDHENGLVTFSGGVPGGYCGRVKGDPGLTNVIAEVIFQVPGLTIGKKGPDVGEIMFDIDTEVLLNDGRGTKAELILGNSLFNVTPPGSSVSKSDWFDSVSEDRIKPEPFSIELVRAESVYNGKWFIIFNTLDKQTGIDHFEVYETNVENEGYVVGKKDTLSVWKRVQSPYLLEDQSLNSVIRVKAFDKAGNERIAGRIPDETLRDIAKSPISKSKFYTIVGLVSILVVCALVFLMYKKMSKKKEIAHDTIIDEDAELSTNDALQEDDKENQSEGNGTQ